MSRRTRVARGFKRRLGDPVPLMLGGAPMSADALMGEVDPQLSVQMFRDDALAAEIELWEPMAGAREGGHSCMKGRGHHR